MNREIKFRAWDNNRKCFINPNYTLKDLTTRHFVFDNNLIWMQFTGLKDKKGKEIYEGDIFDSPSGRKFIVEWLEYKFVLRGVFDERYSFSLGETYSDWNIIGNIKENPELLEEGK